MSGFSRGRSFRPSRGRGFSRDGASESPHNGGRWNDRQVPRDDATVISVPSRFIGRLIGRGGSNITEMQRETEARIIVTKEEKDGETVVKLIGNSTSVAQAQSKIEELMNSSERKEQRGGNQEQRSYQDQRGGNQEQRSYQDQRGGNQEQRSYQDHRGGHQEQRGFQGQRNYQGQRSYQDQQCYQNQQSYQDRNNYQDQYSYQNHHNYQPTQYEGFTQEVQEEEVKPVVNETIDYEKLLKDLERREREKLEAMPKIIKNFYEELPEVRDMPEEEVEHFRVASNNISVSRILENAGTENPAPIPNPVKDFHQAFHNHPEILEEIKKAGFARPSPIQCQAWPVLLSGQDLIGIAQTGTGKTLAFLLPALLHIEGQIVPRKQRLGPTVLIMAPTRELALQIDREVKKYHYRGIKSICIYGGGDRRAQIDAVKAGVDIVIATPGRLNDLVEAEIINVYGVSYAVLDEADRMLDMGFEPQIRKVMYKVRKDRQTAMTSATWPFGVRRLAQSYMNNPVQVYVGSLELAAVHTVTQTILMIEDNDAKFHEFLEFCTNMNPDQKVICFCGKKVIADFVGSELAMKGIDYQILHGDVEQCDREQAVADITNGAVNILIATDVASRGLDILDITHVVNYDFPRNIEEYVHRVGRTGRAGRTGASISYFTRSDWHLAKELIAILEEAGQYVPQELHDMSERHGKWLERKEQERPRGGGGFRGRRDQLMGY